MSLSDSAYSSSGAYKARINIDMTPSSLHTS
jgi:hypothetical protein